MSEILKFTGVVESLSKGEIPKVYIATITSDDGVYRTTMDVHEDLKVFDEGDKVEISISTKLPNYVKGKDFVGRGVLYVRRIVSEGVMKIQISIGGLQLTVVGPVDKMPEISEVPLNVYVKASKL